MKLFAISDLHLGHQVDKPMTKFGPHWQDHVVRVEASWRGSVSEEDVVLVPGDLSWGMTVEESRVDLEWFGSLPGKKVVVKGNHDYWWPKSRARLSAALGTTVLPLKRNAARLGSVGFIGVRGSDLVPLRGKSPEAAEKEIDRELADLDASIADLRSNDSGLGRVIALTHYPPFALGRDSSPFTERLEAAGASLCVYGHLHDEVEWRTTFQGTRNGIDYRLVSCDAIGFEVLAL